MGYICYKLLCRVFLRSQIVTLEPGRGQHRKYLPYALTEQGVAMLSRVGSACQPRYASG